MESESGQSMDTPSFISGNQNGVPIYSRIRVVPWDVVEAIENEIDSLEKLETVKASSSVDTLV